MSNDRMLRTRDVAERLGYTTAVVSKRAKQGTIPGAVKIFGEWRFDPDTFESWVASQVPVDTWAAPKRGALA